MVNAAMEHGLRMEAVQGNWVDSQYIPSMSPFYQVLEYFPIKRLSYTNPVAVKRWYVIVWWVVCRVRTFLIIICHRPPHHSGGRHIQPRQLIHRSVLAYMQEHPDYRPAASLPLGSAYTWREIQQRVTTQSMKDVLESMKDIVEQDQQDQVSVEVEALLSELGTIMETSNMGSQAAQRGLTRFVELAPSCERIISLCAEHIAKQMWVSSRSSVRCGLSGRCESSHAASGAHLRTIRRHRFPAARTSSDLHCGESRGV